MKTQSMKYTVITSAMILALTSVSMVAPAVYAQNTNRPGATSPTAEPEATKAPEKKTEENSVEESVQELKEKVESKVSELSENRKTYAGVVLEVGDDTMKIESEYGEYTIDIDTDLTKAYRIASGSTSEIKLADIEKSDYILVSGPEIGNTITANAIYVDEQFVVTSGKIVEVNSDSFYIRVQTLAKDSYILDIEQKTTQQILNIKSLELETAGFSKLKEGDNVHFVARKGTQKDQSRYSAVKTIIIPQEYFIK